MRSSCLSGRPTTVSWTRAKLVSEVYSVTHHCRLYCLEMACVVSSMNECGYRRCAVNNHADFGVRVNP